MGRDWVTEEKKYGGREEHVTIHLGENESFKK